MNERKGTDGKPLKQLVIMDLEDALLLDRLALLCMHDSNASALETNRKAMQQLLLVG